MICLFAFFVFWTPPFSSIYGISPQSSVPLLQTVPLDHFEGSHFILKKESQIQSRKQLRYFQNEQTGEKFFLDELSLQSPLFDLWRQFIDLNDNENMKKNLKLEHLMTSDALNTLCYFAIKHNLQVIVKFIFNEYPQFKADIYFDNSINQWQSLLHFFILRFQMYLNNNELGEILKLSKSSTSKTDNKHKFFKDIDCLKLKGEDRVILGSICQSTILSLLINSGATLLADEMDVMKLTGMAESPHIHLVAPLAIALSDTDELNNAKQYGTQLSASIHYYALGLPSVYKLFLQKGVNPDDSGKTYKDVQVAVANGAHGGTINTTIYYENSLQWASWMHHAESVHALLQYGASPSFKNYQGRTPLHFVMLRSNDRELLRIFGFNLRETINALISYGADLNSQDAWGMTPPMLMTYQTLHTTGQSPINLFVQNSDLLLNRPVDVNIVDCRNWTLWDMIRLNRHFQFEEKYLEKLPLPSTADSGHFLGLPLPLQKHLIDIAQENIISLTVFEDSEYEGLNYEEMKEFAQKIYFCNQNKQPIPIHNKVEAKLFFAIDILPQDRTKYITEAITINHLKAISYLDNPHDVLFVFSRLVTNLCEIGTEEEALIQLFQNQLLNCLASYLTKHSTEDFLKTFFRDDLHMNVSYLLIFCQIYLIEPTGVSPVVIQFSKEVINQLKVRSQIESISNRVNYYLSLWGDDHTLRLDRVVDEMFKAEAGLLFPLLLFIDNTMAPLILDSYEKKGGQLPLYNSDVDREFRWMIFFLLFRKIVLYQGEITENLRKKRYKHIIEEKQRLLDSVESHTDLENLLPPDKPLEFFGRSISWKDDNGLYHHVKFRKEKETDEEFLGVARLNCAIDQGQLWTRGFQKGRSGLLTQESAKRVSEMIRMASQEMKTKNFQAKGEFYYFVVEHPNYNKYLDPMNYEGALDEFSYDLSHALFCLSDSIKNGVPVQNLSELNHDEARKTNFTPFFQYISWGVHGQGQADFTTNEDNNPFKYVNLSVPDRKNGQVLGGLRDLDEIKKTSDQYNQEAFDQLRKGLIQIEFQKLTERKKCLHPNDNFYQEAISIMECLETANWMLLKMFSKDFYLLHHMSIEKGTELFLNHYRSFLEGFGYPQPDEVLNAIRPSIQANLIRFKNNPQILELTVPRAAGRDSSFQDLFMASCYTTTCLARFRIESHLLSTSIKELPQANNMENEDEKENLKAVSFFPIARTALKTAKEERDKQKAGQESLFDTKEKLSKSFTIQDIQARANVLKFTQAHDLTVRIKTQETVVSSFSYQEVLASNIVKQEGAKLVIEITLTQSLEDIAILANLQPHEYEILIDFILLNEVVQAFHGIKQGDPFKEKFLEEDLKKLEAGSQVTALLSLCSQLKEAEKVGRIKYIIDILSQVVRAGKELFYQPSAEGSVNSVEEEVKSLEFIQKIAGKLISPLKEQLSWDLFEAKIDTDTQLKEDLTAAIQTVNRVLSSA